jgi:hypothetical protein
MEAISRATRDKIASAAHHRCEYCQTSQAISGAQMHIEHIIPLSRGGTADESNLYLTCAWCNSYKWAHTHVVMRCDGQGSKGASQHLSQLQIKGQVVNDQLTSATLSS